MVMPGSVLGYLSTTASEIPGNNAPCSNPPWTTSVLPPQLLPNFFSQEVEVHLSSQSCIGAFLAPADDSHLRGLHYDGPTVSANVCPSNFVNERGHRCRVFFQSPEMTLPVGFKIITPTSSSPRTLLSTQSSGLVLQINPSHKG